MSGLIVEHAVDEHRLSELGVNGWPRWKDPAGITTQHYEAAERSYFLAGEAILTHADAAPVHVVQGDLVVIPEGECRWEVIVEVRRHYRSDALSPACCII